MRKKEERKNKGEEKNLVKKIVIFPLSLLEIEAEYFIFWTSSKRCLLNDLKKKSESASY